jgi:hypothetical protein
MANPLGQFDPSSYHTPTFAPMEPEPAADLAELTLGAPASGDKSPPGSPPKGLLATPDRKPKPPIGTPSPVRAFKDQAKNTTPDRSHIRREQEVFARCLGALGKTKDTPERRAKATHTERTMVAVLDSAVSRFPGAISFDSALGAADLDEATEEKGAPLSVQSLKRGALAPPMHPLQRRRCTGFGDIEEFSGTWPDHTLQSLMAAYLDIEHRPEEDYPFFVVNLGHALFPSLAGKGAVGFHMICKENEQLQKDCNLKLVALNRQTDVWAGEYLLPGSKGAKVSTFFPRSIDSSQKLLELLSTGKVVAEQENRRLMEIPGQKFHVELYLRQDFVVWSCFPVYYFAPFDAMASYQISDAIVLNAGDVLKCAKTAKKPMYRMGDAIIIDIAPLIPACPIKSGIYISFPKDHLK